MALKRPPGYGPPSPRRQWSGWMVSPGGEGLGLVRVDRRRMGDGLAGGEGLGLVAVDRRRMGDGFAER